MVICQLRAEASVDCFAEVFFSEDLVRTLGDVLEALVSELNRELAPAVSVFLRAAMKDRPRICIIAGEDLAAMAGAYHKLVKLQRGVMMRIEVADRPKLFPPRWDEGQRRAVGDLLSGLRKKHGCVIKPCFATSSVQLIGGAKEQATVAAAIRRFMAQARYETRIYVPTKLRERAEAALSSLEGLSVARDRARLVLSSLDYSAILHARQAVSEVLVSHAGWHGDKDCCVCYDVCEDRLATCGHRLCEGCGADYIAGATVAQQVPVCCPSCSEPLFPEDLSRFTSTLDDVYAAGVATFMAHHREEYAYCHTPDCAQILDNTLEAARCPVCLHTQCPRCGAPPHPEETCAAAEARRLTECSQEAVVARHSGHIVEALLAPFCPGCKLAFVDFDNCFAIQCSICAAGFCGFCLENCTPADPHTHTAS